MSARVTRSMFRDLYPEGSERIHHVGVIVDDVKDEGRRFHTAGLETTLCLEAAMIDTRAYYDHYIRLSEASPRFLHFYELVRQASIGFDGTNLFRRALPTTERKAGPSLIAIDACEKMR